jgi:hypothetical protein
MKRLFLAFAVLLIGASAAWAQPVQTVVQTAGKLYNSSPRIGVGESLCQAGVGGVINDHTFVFHANGAPSALLVTVTGSTGAGSSSITTSTNTAGASIHFTGVYNNVCLVATSITGANAYLDASYEGINAASAASGAVTVTSGTIAIDQSSPGTSNLVACSNCSGGTSDADDGSIAGAQTTGLALSLGQFWDGSVWRRLLGNATDGLLVNLGANNDVTVTSGTITAVTGITNALPAGSNIIGNFRIDQTTPGTTNNVSLSAETTKVIGTVRGASGGFASGTFASGAFASGSYASGAFASGSIADGADVTLGAKADAKSTATDTTAVTLMQVSKQISASVQAIAALAATDPCAGTAKTVVAFSISSATTTELYDGSSSNYTYVCSFNIVVAAANNVAIVEDATDTCASPDAGMAGGVTAATGWNFAANGGLTLGNGNGTIMKAKGATANRVCLMTSGTAQTSGTIVFVAAP